MGLRLSHEIIVRSPWQMCTSHKTNVERCLLQMGTCPTKEVKVHEGRDVLEITQGNKPNEASGQWNRRKKEI